MYELALLGKVALLIAPVRCYGLACPHADKGCYAAHIPSASLLQLTAVRHKTNKTFKLQTDEPLLLQLPADTHKTNNTFTTSQTDGPWQLAAALGPLTCKWHVLVLACGLAVLAALVAASYCCQRDCSHETDPVKGIWTRGSICTAAICTLLWSVAGYYHIVHDDADWKGAWYGLVLFFGIDLCEKTVLAVCMHTCYRLLGFPSEEIAAIQGSRASWTTVTASFYMEKYGERCVKFADAINRRIGHVVDGVVKWSFFVPLCIPTQSQRVAAMITYGFFKVLTMLVLIHSDGTLARVLFRASRIRDGCLGRLNLMLVTFVVFGFYPVAGLLIFHSHIAPTHVPFVMGYCWQALIWGDTMAEIIGSFFGRFEFEVCGFGDINRKTVEGVISCYVASFCAVAAYTAVNSSEFPHEHFGQNMIMVNALSALVATIAETAAPRGMDNGFMVLGVALVVIHFYQSEITGSPTYHDP